MKKVQLLVSVLLLVSLLFACAPQAAPAPAVPQVPATPAKAAPVPAAAPARPAWQEEWDRIVAAAKQEGVVVTWIASGQWRQPLAEAFSRKYGIRAEILVIGRPAESAAKLFAERRAGLYTVDVFIRGLADAVTTLKPAGTIDPLEPALILPEVVDPKLWHGAKLPFVDRDHTILGFLRYVLAMLAVNTDLVREGEIKSYNDLLDPKWKGKIIINDPTTAGAGSYIGIIAEPFMGGWDRGGGDFFRKLVKNEPIVMRDQRLQVDWLARGKVAIAVIPPTDPLTEFMKIGAPIRVVTAKEGGVVTAGWGGVWMINRAPHPNAGKVFINWLLSKEGQTVASKAVGYPSARVDVPTDFINPIFISEPNVNYFYTTTEEWPIRNAEDRNRQLEIFGALVR